MNDKEEERQNLCKTAGLDYSQVSSYFSIATPENFQVTYNTFVAKYPSQAKIISALRPNGVGPGETVISFLFDNITLGGSHAPCDLYKDGQPWAEVKGVKIRKSDHSAYNFKLSRDQSPSVKYITQALGHKHPIVIDCNGNLFDCDGNRMCHFSSPFLQQQVEKKLEEKTKTPVDRCSIVEKWKSMIFYEYVGGKPFALINSDSMKMHYFDFLTKPMVDLHMIHRNQPWARVYLPRE